MSGAYITGAVSRISTRRRPIILFYGVSIEMGYDATPRETKGYTSLIANFDYTPQLDAADGRRLLVDLPTLTDVQSRVTTWAAGAPDFVWLAIGTNDCFAGASFATFQTRYEQLLDEIATQIPTATIFAQTPIVRSGENAATPEPLSSYRTAIGTLAGARPAVVLVDGTTLVSIGDLDDGTHPTTAGHAIYTSRVAQILEPHR